MSKKLSFRGSIIPATDPQRIKLSTMNGKTGYKITKLQIISNTPGVSNVEHLVQIYSKYGQGPSTEVDFTNDALLAVAYYQDEAAPHYPSSMDIIFDNEVVNQDIYIAGADVGGGVVTNNYYVE